MQSTAWPNLSPPVTRPGTQIQALINSAVNDEFYHGRRREARAHLDQAFKELQNLPPGTERRALYRAAAFAQAKLSQLRAQGPTSEAADWYRLILRLEPAAQMDDSDVPPDIPKYFEKIRKEVASAQKGRLLISSTPEGTAAFLDGQFVGNTPLDKPLLEGTYQLVLARGKSRSFPRTVNVSKGPAPTSVRIDVGLEGLFTEPIPCFSGDEHSKPPVSPKVVSAALANRLNSQTQQNIERIILLSIKGAGPAPGLLQGELIDVRTLATIRAGAFELLNATRPQQEDIDDLVDYFVTGIQHGHIVPSTPSEAPTTAVAPPPPVVGVPVSFLEGAAWTTTGLLVLGLGATAVSMGQNPTAWFAAPGDSSDVATSKAVRLALGGALTVATGTAVYYVVRHSLVPRVNHQPPGLAVGVDLNPSSKGQGFVFTMKMDFP